VNDKFDQMAAERDALYQAKWSWSVWRKKGYLTRWIGAILHEDANIALARARMDLWQAEINSYIKARD
jgi:hypothetical protein